MQVSAVGKKQEDIRQDGELGACFAELWQNYFILYFLYRFLTNQFPNYQ